MSAVDVEKLLTEISPDNPSGPDLEYDAAYAEMTRLATAQAGQGMIETGAQAEEVDWKEVKRRCLELSGRSRDLRLAIYLTRALLRTDGLPGLSSGLEVVRGLLERFWETVHPRLDPDDGNDPTIRVNTLVALCHAEALLDGLRATPVASARGAGRFSLRDALVATGRMPAPGPGEPPAPEPAALNAAFTEVGATETQALAEAVARAVATVEGIEDTLTRQVGAAQSADFTPLSGLLKNAGKVLNEQLARMGVGVAVSEGEAGAGEAQAGTAQGGSGMGLTGNVASRDEALRALDKVIEYFQRNEPSSPLPLVLSRARKLAAKGFIEIMRDLAPDGLTQVEMVTRARDEQ